MITEICFNLKFPLGATFYTSLEIEIYKKFLYFLKSLSCFNQRDRCQECPYGQDCKYYFLTGENFQRYPAVFLHINRFSKQRFTPNDELQLKFYWIGKSAEYIQFADVFFQTLNQQLWKHPFYIHSRSQKKLNNEPMIFNHIKVKSVIETADLKNSMQEMLAYYNQQYETNFKGKLAEFKKIRSKPIYEGSFALRTRKITMKGIIGEFESQESNALPASILEIGIGKWNFLGGGKIAIKNQVD